MFQVKVGDKECDVMIGFKMYIIIKLGNFFYILEVSERNFVFLIYVFKLFYFMQINIEMFFFYILGQCMNSNY